LKADLILKSKTIFTATAQRPIDGFIAIKGNKILAVGTKDEFNDWRGKNTQIKDFEDQLILPGFCDSHLHLFLGALENDTINVVDSKSEEEAAKMLYDFYRDRKDEWVIGFGWFHYHWKEKNLPTKNSLDKYFPDRPVCVFNEEVHSLWVNSKALEVCGITKDTPDPPGGEIYRDHNGEPTGYLLEPGAMKLITKKALEMPLEKEMQIFEGVLKKAAQLGVTSVSDIHILDILKIEAYDALEKEGKLTLRIHFAPSLQENIEKLKMFQKQYRSEKLQFTGVKEFIDGTAMAYTGLLIEPYADRPDFYGCTMIDPKDLKNKMRLLSKENIRTRLHACGDGAVRLALDIIEEMQKENPKEPLRHTIEHIENIHPGDLKRFKELGVIASVQPDHLWVDVYEEHPFHQILGEERNQLAWPFKSLLQHGAPMAFGTDYPISDLDPMRGIYRAVTRLHEDGEPKGGWIPKEKLSVAEALKQYTIGSAYQMFREKELGTLEAGKLADIVVLDRNLFEIPPEQIREAKAVLTIMDGKIIYEADAI
jgi:predicted amidohydrolase YtcJ